MSQRGSGLEADPRPRVVCLGETMLMFAPPPHQTIEYALDFRVFSGGSESNVAIGLERLGMHAAWIGKLPENALGRKVVNEIRAFGVDTSRVVWADHGRVGTFFFEWGAPPRPLMTIYDRADSAACTMVADDVDWEFVSRADWLHLTGITPALSGICRESTAEIASRARELGVKVSLDVNYRSLLWSKEDARRALAQLLANADLLIATEQDAEMLLGERLERPVAVKRLAERYACAAVAMTLGGEGSIAYLADELYRSPGYEVSTVNRLGAGDAFAAGLLYGYMRSGMQAGLDYGGAMAALKMTIPQNTPLINRPDVERLLQGRDLDLVR